MLNHRIMLLLVIFGLATGFMAVAPAGNKGGAWAEEKSASSALPSAENSQVSDIPEKVPARFDVTSVKPTPPERLYQLIKYERCTNGGSFFAAGTPLRWTVVFAYAVLDMQVSAGPPWLDSFDAAYEIEGKPDHNVTEAECRIMVQSLLVDRFKLKVHQEAREVAAYALVVGKNGHKVQPAKPAEAGGGVRINGALHQALSEHNAPDGWSMSRLAGFVADFVGRPVVDHTELPGTYSFSIRFAHTNDSSDPAIATALQEQLGLRLESTKTNLDMVVIDHIEKPDPN